MEYGFTTFRTRSYLLMSEAVGSCVRWTKIGRPRCGDVWLARLRSFVYSFFKAVSTACSIPSSAACLAIWALISLNTASALTSSLLSDSALSGEFIRPCEVIDSLYDEPIWSLSSSFGKPWSLFPCSTPAFLAASFSFPIRLWMSWLVSLEKSGLLGWPELS